MSGTSIIAQIFISLSKVRKVAKITHSSTTSKIKSALNPPPPDVSIEVCTNLVNQLCNFGRGYQ